MGLFAAAPSLTAGAGANAGGGRGGAFQIQTSLRQTDRSGGETDASPDADGTSGDGPSFEAVLQSAARSQDSTPPAASDQGNGAPGGAGAKPAGGAAKSQSGGDADESDSDGAGGADGAQGEAQNPAAQASQSDSRQSGDAGSPQANKPAASGGKGTQGSQGADDQTAAQNAAATLALETGTVANAAPPPPPPPPPAPTTAGADSGEASVQGGGSPLPVPITLANSIQRAIALHQVSPAPSKASREASGKDAPSPEDSAQLKSEAKEAFLHVAESRPQKGAAAQADVAAGEASAAGSAASAAVSGSGEKGTGPAAEDASAVEVQAGDSAAPAALAAAGRGGDADSRAVVGAGRVETLDAGKPVGTEQPMMLAGAVATAQHEGGSAEIAAGAQESPLANASETYDQIVLGLKGQMDPKTGKAQILLDPPNLGAVKVSLSLTNGVLTAQFESSTGAVRDLLKSNLDKLKSVLQAQGIAVDRLAVNAPAANDAGTTGGQMQQHASGSAAHDGRSAGGFGQEARSGQDRWQNTGGSKTFAQMFAQSQEAPIDLVA